MNPELPTRPTALNQPPIPNVGKTGFYVAVGRTIFRFPESFRLPNGQVINGHRLPYRVTSRIKRAFSSKYSPHVGLKQRQRMAARLLA